MSMVDLSIRRERYFKDELTDYKTCPKCQTPLEKGYASYLVFVKDEEDDLIMGNKSGLFCPKCPVIVLDKKAFAEDILAATHKRSVYFHIAGIVNTDAIPENKKSAILGEDDNPIPLVEFLNCSEKNKETLENIENNDRKRKLGRNEPCHCGSGRKYKKCCLDKDLEEKGAAARVEV